MRDKIVAIGLLTQRDLGLLGPTFDRAYPLDRAPRFEDLLHAIDEADEKLRSQSSSQQVGPASTDNEQRPAH